MFDSPTLSVSELATRWGKTSRQVLDYAEAMDFPLYFMFDGLAFDLSDHWLRANGDNQKNNELENLKKSIARWEECIRENSRGEVGEFDQYLDRVEIQERRAEIEADRAKCKLISEQLEQRERDRKKKAYFGLVRAMPRTLVDIALRGEVSYPLVAYHPQYHTKLVTLPGETHQTLDGYLLALEWFDAPPITIENLCAITQQVIAVEAHFQATKAVSENTDGELGSAPDPERRLALLRELGGGATNKQGKWHFKGMEALKKSERRQGRKRASEKTIRADLIEAADKEAEAKRSGEFVQQMNWQARI